MAGMESGLSYTAPRRMTGLPVLDGLSGRRTSALYLGQPIQQVLSSVRRRIQFKPEVDLQDLWKAYMADSYIQRTVDLYSGMLIGSGVSYETTSMVQRYLDARFSMSEVVGGLGWDDLIARVVFDYVLYGNAFLIKSYTSNVRALYGRTLPSRIVAGFHYIPARCLIPSFNQEGNEVNGWVYRSKNAFGTQMERFYPIEDVIHIAHAKPADSAWGVPFLLGVIEDIRALRQMEENVLRMVHKFANPILWIGTPDLTSGGSGIRADMMQIVEAINSMSSDGFLVTMPGQTVKMVGAESIAMRVNDYLDYFRMRAIAGLGINEQMLGQRPTDPDADETDTVMYLRALQMQAELANQIMDLVLVPLLDDARINRTQVTLRFPYPDIRKTLRRWTVISNLYAQSVITLSEARQLMQMEGDFDQDDSYTAKVYLPRVLEPLKLRMAMDVSNSDGGGVYPGRGRPSSQNPPRARGRPSKDIKPPSDNQGGDAL